MDDIENTADPIEAFFSDFKTIVLQHIKTKLPQKEWRHYRFTAMTGKPVFMGSRQQQETWPAAKPEELVQRATNSSSVSVNDVLSGKLKENAVVIGEIQNQHVYFVKHAGFYIWGLDPESGMTWDLWLTWPCYPIGW